MKEYLKTACGLFGRLILVAVMSIFLVLSVTVIFTAVGTEVDGYTATVTDGDGNEIDTYEYKSASGEDTQKTVYEDQGYTVTTQQTRTVLSKRKHRTSLLITQLFCAGVLIIFLYPPLWQIGAKDSNAVHFGHRAARPAFGVIVGALANIPGIALLIGLWIFGKMPVALYAFIHTPFFGIIKAVSDNAVVLNDWSPKALAAVVLTFLVVPAITGVGYWLGFKDIALAERLVYKKKKEG